MSRSKLQRQKLVVLRSDVRPKKWVKKYEAHQLITPEFVEKFRFYSRRRLLHSGIVLSMEGFDFWMKNAGLFDGVFDQTIMKQQFADAIGRKIVMGIYDFLRFLMKACLGRLHITDVMEYLENAPSLNPHEEIQVRQTDISMPGQESDPADGQNSQEHISNKEERPPCIT